MKEFRTRFTVPIYGFKINLVITRDMKKWEKKFPDEYQMGGDCDGMLVDMDNRELAIVIRPETPLFNISHEIGHAARHIMNFTGFKITSENDEPLAYLEGWITEQIHKRIPASPKKCKK